MPTAKTRKRAATTTSRKLPRRGPVNQKTALGERPDTLDVIHRAMSTAAKKAVAENDRLGISTPGAKPDGSIGYRTPAKKRPVRLVKTP